MAGASILRQLSDADLETLHHKLRRDAETDLAIARWALSKVQGEGTEGQRHKGTKAEGELTDEAAAAIVYRYRKAPAYRRWLDRWENQDAALKAQVEMQKQRFEYLSSLVQGAGERGIYEASQHLKGRLLTIAAGMSDQELASGDVKWMGSLLREIREAEKMDRTERAAKAEEVAVDEKLTPEEKRERLKEIFA